MSRITGSGYNLEFKDGAVNGHVIVNMSTKHDSGDRIVSKNLKVKLTDVDADRFVKTYEAALKVDAQKKIRKMVVNEAREWATGVLDHADIYARSARVTVRPMTMEEMLEAAKTDPEMKARMLEALSE